jgi:hypothetical protein
MFTEPSRVPQLASSSTNQKNLGPNRTSSQKYPFAGQSWGWFWVFPSPSISTDPRSGIVRRHHLHEGGIQRAMKQASHLANLTKHATPHRSLKRYPAACRAESSWLSCGLTTQAQRPGAREATIATATLPRGSLQRMVRPSCEHTPMPPLCCRRCLLHLSQAVCC